MISKELRRWLREVDPLTNIQELVLKTCMMSGSFVFGGYDPDTSDRDVLVPPHIHEEIFGHCYMAYESGKYFEEEFRSFYVKDIQGVVFNLLFFHTSEGYEKWKWATEQMIKCLARNDAPFEHKKYRVDTFEQFKKQWDRQYGEHFNGHQ